MLIADVESLPSFVCAEKQALEAKEAADKDAADKAAAEKILAEVEANGGDQDCQGWVQHWFCLGNCLPFHGQHC